ERRARGTGGERDRQVRLVGAIVVDPRQLRHGHGDLEDREREQREPGPAHGAMHNSERRRESDPAAPMGERTTTDDTKVLEQKLLAAERQISRLRSLVEASKILNSSLELDEL